MNASIGRKPIVSIVTPARHAAATLGRTLDSVARQELADWEQVVVTLPDDETTSSLVRDRAADDPRFILRQAESRSAGQARNAGLEAARGDYVLFLDADDTIMPGHLAGLVRASRGRDAGIVMSGHRRIAPDGRPFHTRQSRGWIGPDALAEGPPGAFHAMLFRREVIERTGGFDPRLATNEDWDLCLRAAEAGARLYATGDCTADYWMQAGSLSSGGAAMVRDRRTVARRAARLARQRGSGTEVEPPEGAEPDAPRSDDAAVRHARDAVATLLWTGGCAVARGEDTAPLLAEFAAGGPYAPLAIDAVRAGDALLDGLLVGFACPYGRLERQLAGKWQALARFLGGVADAMADPGFDRAVRRAVECALARIGPERRGWARFAPVGARTVGQSRVVPFWRGWLRPISTRASDDLVIVRVPWLRPRARATFAFAAETAQGRTPVRLLLDRVLGRLGDWPACGDGLAARWRDRALRLALLARRRILRLPATLPDDEPVSHEGSDWEGVFATENPWHYDCAYETAKYERTLALLPPGPIPRALELACAEGHFTRHLAPRVERLTASDISPTALARCAARCGAEGIDNVDYLELDFFDNAFGEDWNLIVSSEVLYYMASRERLERYAGRVAGALADGGHFLHAHAYQVSDTPERSGFDWGDAFAAGTISETFGAHPALERVSAVETELYSIELYRKRSSKALAAPVVHAAPRTVSMRHELNDELAADVVWNGPLATRAAVDGERATRLPVLMYHDIADDGPAGLAPWRTSPEAFEHQLRFLRRRGYRSVTMAEWDHARRSGGALAGRPVLITFDDGLAGFAETAWPILRRNGFGAHVFIVTGQAGGAADWDAWHGAPRRLMDWDRIAALADDGVTFGSHFHHHRPLDRYHPADLLNLAQRSRETMAERIGILPDTIAPPYGICGRAEAEVLRRAGFTRVFMADGARAPVVGPRLRTPRVEVSGGMSIADFAEAIGAADAPEEADRP